MNAETGAVSSERHEAKRPSTPPTAKHAPAPVDPQEAIHPNRHWRTFRFIMRLVFAVWLRYRARGLSNIPTQGGGLLLANHQSFLDPLLIGLPLTRPVSFLARDNLFKIPIIGWAIRNTYVMPINRDAASTASIREAVGRMKQGFLVGIFPEGTRSSDGLVQEFKPGFLALLRRSGLPVYPVGVAGAHRVMPRGRLRFRPRQVCVVFGEPISVEELQPLIKAGDDAALIERMRNRVAACAAEAEAWRLRLEANESPPASS